MGSYAVIASGGKQYRVELGQILEVELLQDPGKRITFDQVLLLVDGDKVEVGQPTVKDASVEAELIEPAQKGDKVRIFRYKAKSRYRKAQGHRQSHTVVKITQIGSHKLTPPKPAKPAKPTEPAKPAKKSPPKSPSKKSPAKKSAK